MKSGGGKSGPAVSSETVHEPAMVISTCYLSFSDPFRAYQSDQSGGSVCCCLETGPQYCNGSASFLMASCYLQLSGNPVVQYCIHSPGDKTSDQVELDDELEEAAL